MDFSLENFTLERSVTFYSSFYFFFNKYYLFQMPKRERETKREIDRETENLPSLVYFLNGLHSLDWSRPRPEAQSSIQVPQMSGRNPSAWVIFHCFPSSLAGSYTGSSKAGTQNGIWTWGSVLQMKA